MSCSARPTTTAPTADVVRNFSCSTSVATSANSVKTMTSWTIVGKRSGTRSARSGFDQHEDEELDQGEREEELADRNGERPANRPAASAETQRQR